MKFTKLIILLSLPLMMLFLQGCPEDNIVDNDSNSGGVVQTFDSQNGGILKLDDGAEIIVPSAAIANKEDGTSGSVSFSIEPNIKNADLPKPIPANYKVVGKIYSFGPSNFVFSLPLQIYLPASSEESPAGLTIIWYNEKNDEWVLLPLNDIDANSKRLGATIFELGYFAIVRFDDGASTIKNTVIQKNIDFGGIAFIDIKREYFYTIMVKDAIFKNPMYNTKDLSHYGVGTGSDLSRPNIRTYMSNLPEGKYTLVISRRKAGTLFELPGELETLINPIVIDVKPFTFVNSWSMQDWKIYTERDIPGDGWKKGKPDEWPKATVPYGTGQFQATLTWVNTKSNRTDLDLHLVGPNGLHVYFGDKKPLDGAVQLDRDWMWEEGNAVENIFSTKTMAKGEYKLYVDVFDGDVPKSYDVRVIRSGSIVKTYRGLATKINESYDFSGSIHILTFRVN